MSTARSPRPTVRTSPRRLCGLTSMLGSAVALCALVASADAAAAAKPTVPPGYTIAKLADVPEGVTNCDDLARLDGHLFMGCQNATMSAGGGGSSTVLEYADDGTLLNTWSIPDKVDGLGGDPLNHRVIVTLNEDAHSHLATLTPSAAAGQQITNYKYSPGAPGDPATTGALHTGGGTDSVNVDATGHIFVTASHPQGHTGTAVLKVTLTPPSSPTGTGVAALSPTWLDNASAANGTPAGGTVKLALGDVDSGGIVPPSSPRFAGSYVIGDQTSQQLVFASDINAGTGLTVIKTPFGLDDMRWATSDGGALYIVDKGAPAAAGLSALYKVTGPFVVGTALASNDGLGDQIVKVNLTTGALTPVVQHLITTKGLVYVDATGTEAPLAVGSAAAVATPVALGAPGRGVGASSSKSDGDALPLVPATAALVLSLFAAAYALTQRRTRPV